MSLSRDVKDFSYRTPRSMQTSKFGPYSKLHIPSRRSRFAAEGWIAFYGASIALVWYGILLWVTR